MAAAVAECVITGLGMRSSLGQNVAQTCAAVRAGINRFGEWPFLDSPVDEEGSPVIGAAMTPALGDGSWLDKLFDLATQPFLEAVWGAGLSREATAAKGTPWGLYLATPPLSRAGTNEESSGYFQEAVKERNLFPLQPGRLRAFPNDQAGGLLALAQAMEDLSLGAVEFAVVGGADSLLHGEYLYLLNKERKLLNAMNPAGLVPGEAAAFVVVERAGGKRPRTPLARLTPVVSGKESVPAGKPSKGEALSQVVRGVLAALPCDPTKVLRIVIDLNGERWRFQEWAMADVRNPPPAPTFRQLWHPADCLGDIGAATAPALLCVAARAFQRRYAVGDALPIVTSSDAGERAAVAVLPV